MASSLRVNAIVPASGTNVAIGTAGGTITYTASVSGVSTFSNGIIVSAGTTAAPSISPSGDSNTGIFFPSADTVCIGEGGSEAIRVNSSGYIGIGNTNPQKLIEISGSATGISTTGRFQLHPHAAGFDLASTAGNIAPHYQTDFTLYTGQIGSGTLRWQIDSSGRVITPYQPAFRAYYSNRSAIVGSGTLVFDQVDNNIGSHYSTSTGRFTSPIAGYYHFSTCIQHYGGTTTAGYVDIRKNGAVVFVRNEHAFGAVYSSIGTSVTIYLAVSDYVELVGSGNVFWADNTSFSGHFLG
jgi:hypothetical protein